jgi:hypothetical protein
MQQDVVITEKLTKKQAVLGTAIREQSTARVAKGYSAAPEAEDARFVDRSG